MMIMFDTQDVELLLELLAKAQAEEMMDLMLIEQGPGTRLVSMKQLEMKLYRLKQEVS